VKSLVFLCLFALPLAAATRVPLADWQLQSSAKVSGSGETISTTTYQPQGWHTAHVPTTVVAALVKDKTYPDPTFGMNLRSIPGTAYKIGSNFSNEPMPADSPFAVPWWYRTQFQLPAADNGRELWLHFAGINYRANIWMNGKKIAGDNDVAGAWRIYDLNVTSAALPGQTNALAVEVFAPRPEDLAITFVDWNPLPPDKEMGLWREVYLTSSGPVALRSPHVVTEVETPSLAAAHLTVTCNLRNPGSRPVTAEVQGQIAQAQFQQQVELAPGETREVVFDPSKYPQLNFKQPRLWWPAQMGAQDMYDLHLQVAVNGQLSDAADTRFGIRQVTSEFTDGGYRLFRINGKRILIRGGGWASDMLLREDPARLEDQFRYTRDMGLNTIRLEGKLETDNFFDLADRYGVLIMAGWCCCDAWEKWHLWPPQNYQISAESLHDQISRLQNHPSFFAWLNGSDNPPPPDVENRYIQVLKQVRWQNPYVSSATAKPTAVTGNSGVKMTGPYEYVAPKYWLEDSKRGGAYGFNTETSPGPAIPVIESLKKFLPPDKLWPVNEVWDYHAGGGVFHNVEVYTHALEARYGPAVSLDDYDRKSQLMAYEGIRAMFEAYSRDKYRATGVIQWMLNNAWPSVIWHLYDYYLQPAGGYFGAKKACEPLHAQYDYTDHSVALVNSTYREANGLKVTARVLNLDGTQKFSKESTADALPDSSAALFPIPELQGLSPTYFLRLETRDRGGKLLSSNLYWLSTKPETLDWSKSTWYFTPTAQFADYTALEDLPEVQVQAAARTDASGEQQTTHVSLQNAAKSPAFFVRLKLARGAGGQEVLPVLYEENYITLLPGEKRDIAIAYRAADLGGSKPAVEVSGWNVPAVAAQ
jgi:exo-1,4-beta-D-glucosaminidase